MRKDRYWLIIEVKDRRQTVALYDHRDDPYETRNVARSHPEIVERLMPLLFKGNPGIIEF
jgi:arylsulfatase A-like enzyme